MNIRVSYNITIDSLQEDQGNRLYEYCEEEGIAVSLVQRANGEGVTGLVFNNVGKRGLNLLEEWEKENDE